jgi:hypothetical protein
VSGRSIRAGTGAIDVTAQSSNGLLRTEVVRGRGVALLVGQVLPAGAQVKSVTLDGRPAAFTVRQTARGNEVVADAGSRAGTTALVVTLR